MSLSSSHTENGDSPADLLVSAIAEQRPIVLILGQNAWSESKDGDAVLARALGRLGRDRNARNGWATSSLDPTLKELLEGRGRQPEVILTANETPPAARSRARPPLYHLFSRAGEHDPAALLPASRPELNTRRTGTR